MDKTAQSARKDMDAQIKTFYEQGNWTDAKPLVSGAYQHLSTSSTWSLDHVTNMINAVRDSVFSGKSAPPQDPNVPNPSSATGNQASPIDGKTKALMAMMGGTELIIASAAFDIISGVLAQFKSSTQTDLVKNVANKEIIPGLSLFVCVIENKYHRSDFFQDEFIIQNFYLYD